MQHCSVLLWGLWLGVSMRIFWPRRLCQGEKNRRRKQYNTKPRISVEYSWICNFIRFDKIFYDKKQYSPESLSLLRFGQKPSYANQKQLQSNNSSTKNCTTKLNNTTQNLIQNKISLLLIPITSITLNHMLNIQQKPNSHHHDEVG